MTDFPFDIVGFDLDGTLVDSSGDIAAAVNHVLTGAALPPLTLAQVKQNIGGGGKQMLERSLKDAGGFDEETFAPRYQQLLAYYGAHLAVETRPFAGVIEALDTLAALGVTLAVVTNKVEDFAARLLEQLGLTDRFACLIGGDTLGEGNAKPSPAPILEMIKRCGGGRAAFIGDSIYDMEAARAAEIPGVAVSFGFLSQPAETLGANAVIDHYDDLIPALRRIGASSAV